MLDAVIICVWIGSGCMSVAGEFEVSYQKYTEEDGQIHQCKKDHLLSHCLA